MNSENQPQQKILALILDEMRAGFARIDTKFDRVDAHFERLQDQRNKDFRILLGISTATALGTIGLIVKVFATL